jgi:hypothetical protein
MFYLRKKRDFQRNFSVNTSSLSLPREPLANLLDFLKDCFRKRSLAESETGPVGVINSGSKQIRSAPVEM